MRLIHSPNRERCHECGERADIVVARGHRLWYSCWDDAPPLLEQGGKIVAGDLTTRRR
ncbi:hypothetical protein NDI76_18980 [Halogeometricum sp. S1BR25-6]|uniref:Small CPxCG-related zinc finger protein n=1 Tax=Halogeometricum salsisoli TaxID=2950536 RepID=A0ABU2GJ26_9EURY|nr:hypothetical protein [Halogeometricum sp. S1BR25-6]MDS0300837.1 hypothetical protein [Halogeometricum sp. S1BR25-6]